MLQGIMFFRFSVLARPEVQTFVLSSTSGAGPTLLLTRSAVEKAGVLIP